MSGASTRAGPASGWATIEDYHSEMLATRLKVTGIEVVSAGELTL
ncbi:MAG: hypothetical protein ACSLEN_08125 [Candidatus Malihini olakiniferum]